MDELKTPQWVLPATIGLICVTLVFMIFSRLLEIINLAVFFLTIPQIIIGYFFRRTGIPAIIFLAFLGFVVAHFLLGSNISQIGQTGLISLITLFVGLVIAELSENRSRILQKNREKDERFLTIFHNQQTGLMMVDAETHVITDINATALAMIGSSKENVVGKTCHNFICPAEEGKCPVSDLKQEVDHSERLLLRSDGTMIPILKSVKPVTLEGHLSLIESFVDLTQQKEQEKEIAESRKFFDDIISFLPDPLFAIDAEGKVTVWNYAMKKLTGVPSQAVLGKGDYEAAFQVYGSRRPFLAELILHPDEDLQKKYYPNLVREGSILSSEQEISFPRGKKVVLWVIAAPLYSPDGKLLGAIESFRDVSRLKSTGNALLELNLDLNARVRERTKELERVNQEIRSANRYNRSLFESDLDPLVLIGPDGIIRDINSAVEKMTGRFRGEIIGRSFLDFVADRDEAMRDFQTVLIEGNIRGSELQIRNKDGKDIPVLLSAVLFEDDEKNILGVFVSVHDITLIKENEQIIRNQLKEKEVLLREIHHRVKNNLQVIVSLIGIQTRAMNDDGSIMALKDISNRIRAISLVHQRLYTTGDLTRINLRGYLQYLVLSLAAFYHIDTRKIEIIQDVPDVELDLDTMTPLGLLLNEIIANVFLHAFPEGQEGICSITGNFDGMTLSLIIKDTGVGMPDDFDLESISSVGLSLVRLLSSQLQGSVRFFRENGETSFIISIPIQNRSEEIHNVNGI